MLVFLYTDKCVICNKPFVKDDPICTDEGRMTHEACKDARWTEIFRIRELKKLKKTEVKKEVVVETEEPKKQNKKGGK